MTNSIKRLRTELNISLDDLGFILGVSGSRVHHFESGLSMESGAVSDRLSEFSGLVRRARKNKVVNRLVNDAALSKSAADWQVRQRQVAATTAEELKHQLREMKEVYTAGLNALNLLAAVLNDPECTPETHQLLQSVSARVAKKVLKNSPMQQAKLDMRRKEALGRAGVHDKSST